MNKYVVMYDLRKPNRDYSGMEARIKTAARWVHLQKSVWIIWANGDAKAVFNDLRPYADADDALAVFRLSDEKDAFWVGASPAASSALQANW